MRRVFWIALGASAGVLAVRRLSRTVQRWTPEGVATRAGGAGERLGAFWRQVRAVAADREVELREALGLDGRLDEIDAPPVGDNR